LSVIEGPHAIDVLFEQRRQRMGRIVIASFASHVAMVLAALLGLHDEARTATTTTQVPSSQVNRSIIWLSQAGPGGGGGGGGNLVPTLPRQAEAPGGDAITVPVAEPPKLEPSAQTTDPDLVARLDIPANPLGAGTQSIPGAIEAPPSAASLSQGPGASGGAGSGTGGGIGPDAGPGLRSGRGGGTGGNLRQPASGVTTPRLVREVKPTYTSDAMRAKVQGTVLLECVVTVSGDVADVKVLRSLDANFGLDQEAIKAARQWRFSPATRLGVPVPVLITIELAFTLR
jgi:protein TonB